MNNDLISRQAAIDEIKGFQQGAAEWRDEQEERSDIWHRADSAIASALEIGLRVKKLPSAQQWIPCSERLPESNQCVLVSIKGEVDVDWIAVNSTGYGWWYRCMKDVMSVEAWMPLPEPYKGEES